MTTSGVGAAIGPVLIALGAALAVVGVVLSLRAGRRRSSWITVPGRVIGATDEPAGMVTQHISYRHANRKHELSRRISGAASRAGGTDVELLVNPDDPDRAVVVGGTGPRATGFALILSGLIAVVIGLVLTLGAT